MREERRREEEEALPGDPTQSTDCLLHSPAGRTQNQLMTQVSPPAAHVHAQFFSDLAKIFVPFEQGSGL